MGLLYLSKVPKNWELMGTMDVQNVWLVDLRSDVHLRGAIFD